MDTINKQSTIFELFNVNKSIYGLNFDINFDNSFNNNFEKYNHNKINLPISIFNNDYLSSLQTITKYLKEEKQLTIKEIADLTNRSQKTIWDAYNNSKNKMKFSFGLLSVNIYDINVNNEDFFIPYNILQNRNFSILETITKYLREDLNLKYSEIAVLLNRDQRTIWTVYNRVLKKINKIETNNEKQKQK
jgi:hypothetical protein